MAQLNNNQKVRVEWNDAVLYSAKNKSWNKKIIPTLMYTYGIFVKKDKNGIIVANPKSFYKKTNKRSEKEVKTSPTFLFIPNGMIEKITTSSNS